MSRNLRQIDRLADWLRQKRRETGLSFPEIAARSDGLVSQGTVANVANKRYETVDARTVRGLARAFDITEQELWDIINGVTPMGGELNYETRKIALPEALWREIDYEARRVKRTSGHFLEALLIAYFGGSVNIDAERLEKIRRTDAVIIPHDEGGRGELLLTRENTDQVKKRSVRKPLSKKSKYTQQ